MAPKKQCGERKRERRVTPADFNTAQSATKAARVARFKELVELETDEAEATFGGCDVGVSTDFDVDTMHGHIRCFGRDGSDAHGNDDPGEITM